MGCQKRRWRKDRGRFLGPWVTSGGPRAPFLRQHGANTDVGTLKSVIRAGFLRVDFEANGESMGEIEEVEKAVISVQEKTYWGRCLFFLL